MLSIFAYIRKEQVQRIICQQKKANLLENKIWPL